MKRTEDQHRPVLLAEALQYVVSSKGGRVLDATVGAGGFALAVLRAVEACELMGLDRDDAALELAKERLAEHSERVHLLRANFADLDRATGERGWDWVDSVIMDVGLSSMQIDNPRRGFSYRSDGPLDMRADRRQRLTASEVLNRYSEDELARVFREYGEAPGSRRVARAVVAARESRPWERSGEFAELVRSIAGRPKGRRAPVEARFFQALRIEVNGELEHLRAALPKAVELLAPGGTLVMISFHSLEDRIVKQAFRREAADCVCPPDFPVCRCAKQARLEILTRKPVRPGPKEVAENPRAAPARLRAARRI